MFLVVTLVSGCVFLEHILHRKGRTIQCPWTTQCPWLTGRLSEPASQLRLVLTGWFTQPSSWTNSTAHSMVELDQLACSLDDRVGSTRLLTRRPTQPPTRPPTRPSLNRQLDLHSTANSTASCQSSCKLTQLSLDRRLGGRLSLRLSARVGG